MINLRAMLDGWLEFLALLTSLPDVVDDAGRDARDVGIETLRAYAEDVTHRWTGTLASAHVGEETGERALLYVGDNVNPRTGQPASAYAGYEHARGGDHAFYDLTVAALGGQVLDRMAEQIGDAVEVLWERG